MGDVGDVDLLNFYPLHRAALTPFLEQGLPNHMCVGFMASLKAILCTAENV
jgi:hypothetical protein